MIIKRTEKDDVVNVMYKSSTILASTYDKNLNDLTIIFKNGGQYKYSGVKQTDYTRFEIAESQGKILNSHIKQYPFLKLDKVDSEPILAEIEKAEIEENVKITKEMIESLRNLVTSFDEINAIKLDILADVEKNIEFYKIKVLKENNE